MALFQKNYYELMSDALRPGGIVCTQSGTYWENMDLVKQTFEICRQVFPSAAFAYACVPTYPTGQIGFSLGSKNKVVFQYIIIMYLIYIYYNTLHLYT